MLLRMPLDLCNLILCVPIEAVNRCHIFFLIILEKEMVDGDSNGDMARGLHLQTTLWTVGEKSLFSTVFKFLREGMVFSLPTVE